MKKIRKILQIVLFIFLSLNMFGCSSNSGQNSSSSGNSEENYFVVEKPSDDIESYFDFSKIERVSFQPSNIVVNYGKLDNATIVYTSKGSNFLYVEEDLIDKPAKQMSFGNALLDANDAISFSEFTEETGIE